MSSPKAKKVVMAFEKEFGETPSGSDLIPFTLGVAENGVVGTDNTKTDDIIGGDFDYGGELYNTYVTVEGSVKMPMTYENMGLALKIMMGEPKTEVGDGSNGAEVGEFIHTFSSVEPCIPSLALQDTLVASCNKTGNQKDIIKLFNGLKGNTMAINASPDGDYTVDMALVGAKANDNLVDDTLTEMDETNKVQFPTNSRIKNAHAELFIDDTKVYKLAKEFQFTIDRGTTAEQVLSAGAIVEDSKFELKGSLSSSFDGEFYKKAKENKTMKTTLAFKNKGNALIFVMEETSYAVKDEARSFGTIYPMNCDFTAFKTNGKQKLQVTLINKVEKY